MANVRGSEAIRRRLPLTLLLWIGLVGAFSPAPPPLIEAAKARDWETVRTLVHEGSDVTVTAPDGATALHWASYWDEVAAADLLIAAGADPAAANDLGATPLWIASQNGSDAMVARLLEGGADPNAALLSGETPVMTAARTGTIAVLELLLAAGGDPNARGARDQTALMWAVSQRHPEAVRVLLAHGADVLARSATWTQLMAVPPHSDPANRRDIAHGDETPLMFAARVGDLDSARQLIDAGSDVNDTDAGGVSATVLAAHSGFGELVDLLLAGGADPNAAEAGFSALHMAIMRRDAPMARTLLEHGADPSAPIGNWTPTRRASNDWSIHPSLVGAPPFWLAARLSQPDMMRLLVEYGADPLYVHHVTYAAAAGTFGAELRTEANTALMAAAGMGGTRRMGGYVDPAAADLEALRLEAVKLALELGVDPTAVDLVGQTAAAGARDAAVREFLDGLVAGR